MARIGKNLQSLAVEIERRASAKRDLIVPATKLQMTVAEDGKAPLLGILNGNNHVLPVQDYAHGQLAEYMGIPMPYYRRMMEEDPYLLATNVNRWLKDKTGKDSRRMVRTLDGRVRAILSDSYRPLENEDLAEAVLPVLMDMNLLFLSMEITDRRLYIKCVDLSIVKDVPTGRLIGDGSHVFFDTVSPAITISNSEIGGGALSIETGVYTKACTNLAMIGSNMRKYHTGKRAELSEDVYALLTDDTKKITDQAVWMQTRDLVRSAFERAKFDALAQRLGEAVKDQIPATEVVEVVERVGRRLTLSQGERKGVLAKLIEGSDLTRYGLHAAITRFSAENEVDYDRATELERLGGDVIDLSANDWREIVTVDSKQLKIAA